MCQWWDSPKPNGFTGRFYQTFGEGLDYALKPVKIYTGIPVSLLRHLGSDLRKDFLARLLCRQTENAGLHKHAFQGDYFGRFPN